MPDDLARGAVGDAFQGRDQNFGWLVDRIGEWPSFAILGIGVEVVAVAVTVVLLRRRGLSPDT